MKLNLALATLAALLFAETAHAYVVPTYRDLKPATQVMLEHDAITDPIVTTTNYILTTNDGPSSAAVKTITSFSHQPDVARNLTITPTGTTGDVESCVVTVSGTNIKGSSISEDFTFAADASSAQTGSKAFKTITSISWAASCESGGFAATWIVGVGEKLGLKHCLAQAGDWAWSVVAGSYESTRATVAVNASAVESNTADFNGTMNGSNDFDAYYIQNFRCL